MVHVSSIQGLSAPKFEHYEGTKMVSPIEYSAIKSGIIAITRYLAKYCKNQNIRVNCISPGGILDNQPEVFLEKYNSTCSSKGMMEAQDLNGTVIYLLSNMSQYVNGHNIIIDERRYTTEQIIAKCCEQLGITTSNNTVYNQSKLLLNNLNQRDRDIIAEALDLNESSNTLS